MSHFARISSAVAVAIAALALPACGGGGSSGSFTPGVGVITITGFSPNPLLGCAPQAFTITGTNFETVTGTTATITFSSAVATPFAGGTSKTATVIGNVVNDTTITGVSPQIDVCGPLGLTIDISVMLESGVQASTSGGAILVLPPAITAFTQNVFPAEIPTAFSVTGTGFGPTGGTATIRFTGTSVVNLFGHGTLPYVDVIGTITSNTNIDALSPIATVCGAASQTADVQIFFGQGCCTAPTTGGAVTFTAPDVTSSTPPTIQNFATGTGSLTGFGFPAGAHVRVRLTSGNLIFNDGTSTSIDVPGIATTDTNIDYQIPLTTVCGFDSLAASIQVVDFPGGSCTFTLSLITFLGPLMTTAAPGGVMNANLGAGLFPNNSVFSTAGGDPFILTPDPTRSFGPIGSVVQVKWSGGGPVFQGGAADFEVVPGVVQPDGTIHGAVPATTSGAFGVTVQIFWEDGSCSNTAFAIFADVSDRAFATGTSIYTINQSGTSPPSLLVPPVPGTVLAIDQHRNKIYGFDPASGGLQAWDFSGTLFGGNLGSMPGNVAVGGIPIQMAVATEQDEVWTTLGAATNLIVRLNSLTGQFVGLLATPAVSDPNSIVYNATSNEFLVEFRANDTLVLYDAATRTINAIYATPTANAGTATWNGALALRSGANARAYLVLDDPVPGNIDFVSTLQLSTGTFLTTAGIGIPMSGAGNPSVLCYDSLRDRVVWWGDFAGGFQEYFDADTLALVAPVISGLPGNCFALTFDGSVDDRFYATTNNVGAEFQAFQITLAPPVPVGTVAVPSASTMVSTSP
jgi:hypothetical protein